MEIVKFKTYKERGFVFFVLLAYVARRIHPNPIFELGYKISGFKSLTFKMKNKPKINLVWYSILMFIPYLSYLILWYSYQFTRGLFWLVLYILFYSYKDAVKDFGWSGRYLIYPIVFWQLLALTYIILYYA